MMLETELSEENYFSVLFISLSGKLDNDHDHIANILIRPRNVSGVIVMALYHSASLGLLINGMS